MRTSVVVLGVMAFAAVGACGGDDDAGRAGDAARVTVVASVAPLADFARAVGGDRVEVVDLTPAGAEPHDLELTPDQADDVLDADLVLVVGGDFQPAVEEMAETRDGPTRALVDDGDVDDADPHAWLDPLAAAEFARRIAEALGEIDGEGRAEYGQRSEEYDAELRALHDEYAAALDDDCARHTVITAHDAFGPLFDRYASIAAEPIAGMSPDEEPSPRRIDELVDLAEREGLTTVFSEPLVPSEPAETVAREAGGLQVEVLDPIETLPDRTTYLDAMRDNLAALRRALDCP